MKEYEDILFTLFYKLSDGSRLRIQAIHTGKNYPTGQTKITVRAIHFGIEFGLDLPKSRKFRRVIWEKGQTHYGPSPSECDDGKESKRAATQLIAMKPGDCDSDFFRDYTREQLDFCETYGEELYLYSIDRYGED